MLLVADQPQVARLGDRDCRRFRDLFFRFLRVGGIIPQQVRQFILRKAGQFEVEALSVERGKFSGQQFFIPSGRFRKPVIRELCCAQHKSRYVAYVVMWRLLRKLPSLKWLLPWSAT